MKTTIRKRRSRPTEPTEASPGGQVPSPRDLGGFFAARGWEPFPFQREAWAAFLQGQSGLIHAPTGLGKTYAALGGPVLAALAKITSSQAPRPLPAPPSITTVTGDASASLPAPEAPEFPDTTPSQLPTEPAEPAESSLRLVWLTPLRALANDTAEALRLLIGEVGLPWAVDVRHGDVSGATRQRQRRHLPEVLITTPESLTLLLSYPDAPGRFGGLLGVVCDEWHELLGTKRGVQAELALARLRTLSPSLRVWGLSATLGNLAEAARTLVGPRSPAPMLIRGRHDKEIVVETLLPGEIECFPWAGHLGTRLVAAVVAQLHRAKTTLIFTNTRSQAELWHQSLLKAAPDLATRLALHHGSLDRDLRRQVEAQLDQGALLGVVCTSSLDLGVDFTPVEQVIQIGSPKGIARLTQRAGRSGHQPGATSRLYGVPTNALEVLEFGAARAALRNGDIESRLPVRLPLDVLTQHVVTTALAAHLTPAQLWVEVTSTAAFQELTPADWQWCLDFVMGTGGVLEAYPEYAKVTLDERGVLVAREPSVIKRHRMAIGTISSDTEITVRFAQGATLGNIEERFVAMLSPGDVFHFAGRKLELIRLRGMVAEVKLARPKSGPTPTWQGGRAPLSSELAAAVSDQLSAYRQGTATEPETTCLAPLLDLQLARSTLPSTDYLVAEVCRYERTHNLFAYPMAGRLVNEGLAALLAYRLSQAAPLTLKTTVNDYGFSLQSAKPIPIDADTLRRHLTPDHLADDLIACLNTAELARRQFREIARVAGLVFQGYPGQPKSAKQLQMSSGLLYDVFTQYDPENRLVEQSRRELLDRQLEQSRLRAALERIAQQPLYLHHPPKLTPFSFPLWAEQLHDQVTSESWHQRLAQLAQALET